MLGVCAAWQVRGALSASAFGQPTNQRRANDYICVTGRNNVGFPSSK